MSWSRDLLGPVLDAAGVVLRRGRWLLINGPALVDDRANARAKLDYSAVISHVPVVRAATAAALPSYTRTDNTITADANGALPAVDGVVLAAGDMVLIKDEAAAHADHGPYVVAASGNASLPWSMTRAPWFDAEHNAKPGALLVVSEGTTHGGGLLLLTTAGPIVLNTTALTFAAPVI